jgi:glutathione S-transferase
MPIDREAALGEAEAVGAHILYGSEPSFYTRKAWAAMRLLGLEVDDRLKSLAVKEEVEAAVDGYHRFPVLQTPEGDWLVDSTEIGLELSRRHPRRSLLPEADDLAFLVLLFDEWVDEWLLRPTVAHRGLDQETRTWAAAKAAMNLLGLPSSAPLPDALGEMHGKLAAGVERFFMRACAINGVTEETRAAVMTQLNAVLDALQQAIPGEGFLFGTRPSLGDAALWGFLEAGLLWEPKPAALVRERAPAIVAFHARLRAVADAGGADGGWAGFGEVAQRLAPVLGGDALGFAGFLDSNRAALSAGQETISLDGANVPVRGFTEKGRRALKGQLEAMEPDARRRVAALGWPLADAITA